MMLIAAPFQSLNAAVNTLFGSSMVLHKTSGPVAFTGIFAPLKISQDVSDVSFSDVSHAISITQTTFASLGFQLREVVTVDDVDYSILDIDEPDASGRVRMQVRRYA